MQQALVRRSDGSYLEIEIGDTYCNTYILVSDEELYSSDWDCGTGLMRAINSAFTSWVLVVGEDYDVVLYGRNAQGWALAYGGLSSMRAWLPNLTAPRSQVTINWTTWSVSFGMLLEIPSVAASLRYLQDKGELPNISINTALSPAIVGGVQYRFYRSW